MLVSALCAPSAIRCAFEKKKRLSALRFMIPVIIESGKSGFRQSYRQSSNHKVLV
jgi:hypothetical protein